MTTVGPSGQPSRRWLGLSRIPLFARCVIIGTALAVAAGAVFGLVRGLDHPPTLPFAVIEGAVLIGVPGGVVAAILAGLITVAHRWRTATPPQGDQP